MGKPAKIALGAGILSLLAVFWMQTRPGTPGPAPISFSPAPAGEGESGVKPAPLKMEKAEMPAEDQRKLQVFSEILASKNDNDSRMDTDLRGLSPSLKGALRAQYEALPPEARNERGTIVFLIGRELNSTADVEFLQTVLSEPPCLGLKSCGAVDRGDDHSQLGSDTTLAYPQLVAIRSYKNYLHGKERDPELIRKIQDSLAAAKSSRNPLISRAAENTAN